MLCDPWLSFQRPQHITKLRKRLQDDPHMIYIALIILIYEGLIILNIFWYRENFHFLSWLTMLKSTLSLAYKNDSLTPKNCVTTINSIHRAWYEQKPENFEIHKTTFAKYLNTNSYHLIIWLNSQLNASIGSINTKKLLGRYLFHPKCLFYVSYLSFGESLYQWTLSLSFYS